MMAQSISVQPAGRQADANPRSAGVPFWRMFSMHALLDEERRPLGEHRAPCGLEGAAPTQLKQCRYAGSRFDHALPMNVSALRQTSQHWDDIAAGIGFLHHGFRDARSELTLAQLWRLLAAVAALPSYLLHRSRVEHDPWSPEAFVAAIYKASLGIKYMLEQLLLQDLLSGRSAHRPADVDELFALSESSGVLVGVEQVCAAPANMIADTLRAFVQGGEPDTAKRSALAAIIGSWDSYDTFSQAARDLYSTLLIFSTLGARIQLALEKEFADPNTPTPADAVPAIESSPLEVSMSVTLGMRRIRWSLAGLDESRCAETLQAFCDITAGEEGSGHAAALVRALNGADAVQRRDIFARQLERELAPQVDGSRTPGFLANTCNQLARYFDLERAIGARVRQIERRLNEALGRAGAADEIAPALAGYCPVPAWKIVSERLGVQVTHELESATIRCGKGQVMALHALDPPRR